MIGSFRRGISNHWNLLFLLAGLARAESFVLPDLPLETVQTNLAGASRGFLLGAAGSDLWRDPGAPSNEFWLVTDRGPNPEIKVEGKKRRTFPVPDYTPTILQVRAEAGRLTVLQTIPLRTPDGRPLTGLPNRAKFDEKPFDYTGRLELERNPNGVDPEGLVRMPDGTFWVAEEYGPSLVHVDAAGRALARHVPAGVELPGSVVPVAGSLPAILARRKENRGFEGLALSSDARTLYAVVQSPLANPDKKTAERSRQARIIAFDPAAARTTAEYVHVTESFTVYGGKDQDDVKLSGLQCLGADRLLLLERTDEVARLRLISLAGASNLLGTRWDDVATSPSLESVTDLAGASIHPVTVVRSCALPGVPEKIEGIALLDPRTVAVVNDNDFDIGSFDLQGRNEGKGTRNILTLVPLAEPME